MKHMSILLEVSGCDKGILVTVKGVKRHKDTGQDLPVNSTSPSPSLYAYWGDTRAPLP